MSERRRCALILSTAFCLAAAASGAEFQVNTHTQCDQACPSVAADERGNFIVVWRSHHTDGRGGGLYGRRFGANAAPLGDEFQINMTPISADVWRPDVAVDSTGRFVVVWAAYRGARTDVIARLYDATGSPLTDEFEVSSGRFDCCSSKPAVAMTPNGTFVVVWSGRFGSWETGKNYVLTRCYDADGVPLGPETVVSGTPNGEWPDVAVHDSGRFVVTWLRAGDMDDRPRGEYIQFRLCDATGIPLQDIISVTGNVRCRRFGPSVAMDRKGDFTIAWAEGLIPHDVYARRFTADGQACSQTFRCNVDTQGTQGPPRIAIDALGRLAVVWDSDCGNAYGYDVIGQCFYRCGIPLTGEFVLNSFAEGRQWYSDIAVTPRGRWVAVWTSEDQDGSSYGVFARQIPGVGTASLDGDNVVNFVDFALLASTWKQNDAPTGADLAPDGIIDGMDMAYLLNEWLIPSGP